MGKDFFCRIKCIENLINDQLNASQEGIFTEGIFLKKHLISRSSYPHGMCMVAISAICFACLRVFAPWHSVQIHLITLLIVDISKSETTIFNWFTKKKHLIARPFVDANKSRRRSGGWWNLRCLQFGGVRL